MSKKANIFILVSIIATLLFSCNNSNFKSPKAVFTVDEVFKISQDNNIAFIDVRDSDEVSEESYKLKNLTNIPLDNLEQKLKEIPKDKQVILLCKSGNRSQKAYDLLKQKGFINIANMEGGMNAWKEKNYPIAINSTTSKTEKQACCSDPTSSDCNTDGTCKTSEPKKEEKACCPKK
ncbi:rhodanese-like domain-containing protein [Flavobacterium sp.]|uniref:rhodanese-like domain-containing protein n=1 Tax=Flavobacterium sp. TaxID=239 RepID=UPI004047546E